MLDDSVLGTGSSATASSTTSSDSGVCFFRPNEISRFQIDGRSSAAGVSGSSSNGAGSSRVGHTSASTVAGSSWATTSSSLVRFLRPNEISRFQIDWRSAGVSVSSSSTGVVSSGSADCASTSAD